MTSEPLRPPSLAEHRASARISWFKVPARSNRNQLKSSHERKREHLPQDRDCRAAEVVRILQRRAVEVSGVMTASAGNAVQPRTFAALTAPRGSGIKHGIMGCVPHMAHKREPDTLEMANRVVFKSRPRSGMMPGQYFDLAPPSISGAGGDFRSCRSLPTHGFDQLKALLKSDVEMEFCRGNSKMPTVLLQRDMICTNPLCAGTCAGEEKCIATIFTIVRMSLGKHSTYC